MSSGPPRGLSNREQMRGDLSNRICGRWVQEVREAMNTTLSRELADRKVAQLLVESEAASLARSVRRARARTLRHNRKALRLPVGWRSLER
jgi:hypothetical protein